MDFVTHEKTFQRFYLDQKAFGWLTSNEIYAKTTGTFSICYDHVDTDKVQLLTVSRFKTPYLARLGLLHDSRVVGHARHFFDKIIIPVYLLTLKKLLPISLSFAAPNLDNWTLAEQVNHPHMRVAWEVASDLTEDPDHAWLVDTGRNNWRRDLQGNIYLTDPLVEPEHTNWAGCNDMLKHTIGEVRQELAKLPLDKPITLGVRYAQVR